MLQKKGNKKNQTISIFIFTVISTEKQGYNNFLFFLEKGVGVGVGGIEEMYLLKFFIFNFFKYFIAYSW